MPDGQVQPGRLRNLLMQLRQRRMGQQGGRGMTAGVPFGVQAQGQVNPVARMRLMERLRRQVTAPSQLRSRENIGKGRPAAPATEPETRAERFAQQWTPEQKGAWKEHQARRLALNKRQQGIAPYQPG